MENRAYSVLEIKSVDNDAREIRGIATTPAPDRVQDVVVPEGAKFALPLPLLWQHDASQPIGHVTEATVTAKGIEVVAKIAKGVDAEIDRAWSRIKSGLVRGLSIGFRSLESEEIPGSWGRKFTSWEWMELSAVTIPANAEASILAVKQYDTEQRAASGQKAVGSKVGASAVPVKSANGDKQMSKKTFAEQISAFEATRAAKSARMAELMDASAESGETLDAECAQEYDDLKGEVKSIDEHLNRLRDMEKLAVKSAADVTNATTTKASESVRTVAAVKGNNLPKGTAFTRYAMALMAGKGNLMQSAEIAKRWDDTPQVETVLKAAVAAGTTTDASWAKPLVEYSSMASEFAELLRPATILGRIDSLRRVPFNIKVPRQTGGASASWVGEGAPFHYLNAEDGVSTGKNDVDFDTFAQYRDKKWAPWLVKELTLAHPAEMKKPTEESDDDCDYSQPEIWQFPAWYFTPAGLYFDPSFARVQRSCEGPEWSVLPWSAIKKQAGTTAVAAVQ